MTKQALARKALRLRGTPKGERLAAQLLNSEAAAGGREYEGGDALGMMKKLGKLLDQVQDLSSGLLAAGVDRGLTQDFRTLVTQTVYEHSLLQKKLK